MGASGLIPRRNKSEPLRRPICRQLRHSTLIGVAIFQEPQSSSASRRPAGAAGFLIFTQLSDRPERYLDPSRLETMPSQPSLRAASKTRSPSALKCSLSASEVWVL
jgi:hypothetical protein